MGALDDATFERLSICGAKRRVWIFAGLGDVMDPEVRQLYIYGECADVFPASAEVLSPAARGQGDLPVLGCQLVGTQPFTWGFPLSLRIIHGSGVSV